MKKLLKFAPLCALLLAVVAFILLLASNGLTYANEVGGQKLTGFYSASAVMFGQGKYQAASGGVSITADFDGKGAWNAVLAFIFVIVALLALLVSAITVFVKVKALEKFGGLIALVAGGLLLVAGIFVFFTKGAFAAANDYGDMENWSVGAGWIVAAILAILGGLVSACPAVLALVEKK